LIVGQIRRSETSWASVRKDYSGRLGRGPGEHAAIAAALRGIGGGGCATAAARVKSSEGNVPTIKNII
jgi:hypothetical protein